MSFFMRFQQIYKSFYKKFLRISINLISKNFYKFLRVSIVFLLISAWFLSGFPVIWQNPRIPPKIKEAQAAQVTIDATVNITAGSHLGGSPTTVFISQTTGYAFYRDSTGACVYSKTTDGGATWGTAVTVDSQTDCINIAVWYDQWTPGDSGTRIHIATIDSGSDDIWYRSFNTANDTFDNTIFNISDNAAYGGTLVAGTNYVSITKSTTGVLYAVTLEGGDSIVMQCTANCTTDANWSENSPAFTLGDDPSILLPQANGAVMLLQWDISADDLQHKIFNGTSWDANWTTIEANAADNTTYDASFGAVIDPSTFDVYLVSADDHITLGNDDDIRVWRYSAGTWSARTDVVTNSVCAGVSNCGITGAKIARDPNTGYLYVLYTARSTPGTSATTNAYWKYSTDNGSTWSAEFGPVYSTNDDIGARLSLMGSSTQRIYATWYAATPDDLFGRPIAPKTFEQSAYRFFANTDSTDVGSPLAAQDTAATLSSAGQAFRLRMLIHVGVSDLFTNEGSFKLQFAQRGADNQCDTAFSGETYADVTVSTTIAYNNNITPADGDNLTENANDPTHASDTVVYQTYEEGNNFTNSRVAVNTGEDGKWDFALIDNGASSNTAYCFRIVRSDNSLLDTYSVIPQITTSASSGTTFSLNSYRFYVDSDSENVTDPWGNPDLAENTSLSVLPATNNPPGQGTELRIRIALTVNGSNLTANSRQFKLQYKVGTDGSCTTGTWTDVGVGGGGEIWRFASSSVTDGTTLTSLKLSVSDVLQVYAKSNPTALNPNSATVGQDIEYDFHIEHNGASDATQYSFRVVESDGTILDSYSNCPTLTTRPGVANLMRHGNFFGDQIERGFFWAD